MPFESSRHYQQLASKFPADRCGVHAHPAVISLMIRVPAWLCSAGSGDSKAELVTVVPVASIVYLHRSAGWWT